MVIFGEICDRVEFVVVWGVDFVVINLCLLECLCVKLFVVVDVMCMLIVE